MRLAASLALLGLASSLAAIFAARLTLPGQGPLDAVGAEDACVRRGCRSVAAALAGVAAGPVPAGPGRAAEALSARSVQALTR